MAHMYADLEASLHVRQNGMPGMSLEVFSRPIWWQGKTITVTLVFGECRDTQEEMSSSGASLL